MIARLFPGMRLHERADPAERVLGVAALPADSDVLARLLAEDPAPEVRAAAAERCSRLDVLAARWRSEADAGVRNALAGALAATAAQASDSEGATVFLASDTCTDAIRADVARRTRDIDRGLAAVAAVRDEAALVDIALTADYAEVRLAAARRVQSPDALRRLADAAREKDRGVARLARSRVDAQAQDAAQAAEAEELLARLRVVAETPGPIVTAVVDLDRRWAALDLAAGDTRHERWDEARRVVQARFDRENDEQRERARFERAVATLAEAPSPETTASLDAMRSELAALRLAAEARGDVAAQARLDHAAQRIDGWAAALSERGAAEALVVEAEQLAASDAIDDGGLPSRWEALPRTARTPALTRRFEAALLLVSQRRVARAQAAEQEAGAARQDVHRLLHAAEQALAAGQLHAARAAADELRVRKAHTDRLPKPTLQRLGRLAHQLTELERWESFGQRNARVQLGEQAEALASASLPPQQLAAEVAKLREAWKALDAQSPGVPKALWDRFDRACEKAYAPAARHFAELAVQRKEARKRREAFIAEASARAAALLQEPRDWRAIDHWLRDTDRTWRGSDLGRVDAKAAKAVDAKLKAAVAPLRDALAQARREAKAARHALIDEAAALGQKNDRGAPARVRELQAQWQAQAKAIALERRDEQALWEQFRAACDGVFAARQADREREDAARHEGRQALEAIVADMDALAKDAEAGDEGDVRKRQRALEDRWRKALPARDPSLRGLEARFASAKSSVDTGLASRRRAREQAVWQILAQKERLCEEADAQAAGSGTGDVAGLRERWEALPGLPAAWEKKLLARRDAALRALDDPSAAAAHAASQRERQATRAELLLKLELALALPSPAALAQQRLALQVALLKARFGHAAGDAGGASELAVDWCAEPGVATAEDRARFERIASALGRQR